MSEREPTPRPRGKSGRILQAARDVGGRLVFVAGTLVSRSEVLSQFQSPPPVVSPASSRIPQPVADSLRGGVVHQVEESQAQPARPARYFFQSAPSVSRIAPGARRELHWGGGVVYQRGSRGGGPIRIEETGYHQAPPPIELAGKTGNQGGIGKKLDAEAPIRQQAEEVAAEIQTLLAAPGAERVFGQGVEAFRASAEALILDYDLAPFERLALLQEMKAGIEADLLAQEIEEVTRGATREIEPEEALKILGLAGLTAATVFLCASKDPRKRNAGLLGALALTFACTLATPAPEVAPDTAPTEAPTPTVAVLPTMTPAATPTLLPSHSGSVEHLPQTGQAAVDGYIQHYQERAAELGVLFDLSPEARQVLSGLNSEALDGILNDMSGFLMAVEGLKERTEGAVLGVSSDGIVSFEKEGQRYGYELLREDPSDPNAITRARLVEISAPLLPATGNEAESAFEDSYLWAQGLICPVIPGECAHDVRVELWTGDVNPCSKEGEAGSPGCAYLLDGERLIRFYLPLFEQMDGARQDWGMMEEIVHSQAAVREMDFQVEGGGEIACRSNGMKILASDGEGEEVLLFWFNELVANDVVLRAFPKERLASLENTSGTMAVVRYRQLVEELGFSPEEFALYYFGAGGSGSGGDFFDLAFLIGSRWYGIESSSLSSADSPFQYRVFSEGVRVLDTLEKLAMNPDDQEARNYWNASLQKMR